jgi:hypothetical protein
MSNWKMFVENQDGLKLFLSQLMIRCAKFRFWPDTALPKIENMESDC